MYKLVHIAFLHHYNRTVCHDITWMLKECSHLNLVIGSKSYQCKFKFVQIISVLQSYIVTNDFSNDELI